MLPDKPDKFMQTLRAIVVICALLPWEFVTFPMCFLWKLPEAYRILRAAGASRLLALKGMGYQSIWLIYLGLKRRI